VQVFAMATQFLSPEKTFTANTGKKVAVRGLFTGRGAANNNQLTLFLRQNLHIVKVVT